VTDRSLSGPLDIDTPVRTAGQIWGPGRNVVSGDLVDERDSGYAAELGARLRRLRRQQQLSLQDVEAVSDHEFRASVLGAYERGERSISVPRLQRLARCYRVPVDQMVPSDDEPDSRSPSSDDEPDSRSPSSDDQDVDRTAGPGGPRHDDRPVTVDLAAVARLARPEGDMLARYLRAIEVQRGDYNGRMLTIRRHDLTAMACIFGCRPEQVSGQLDGLGVRLAR
jgi:transcriptional regulator with XRE-family HTH domain